MIKFEYEGKLLLNNDITIIRKFEEIIKRYVQDNFEEISFSNFTICVKDGKLGKAILEKNTIEIGFDYWNEYLSSTKLGKKHDIPMSKAHNVLHHELEHIAFERKNSSLVNECIMSLEHPQFKSFIKNILYEFNSTYKANLVIKVPAEAIECYIHFSDEYIKNKHGYSTYKDTKKIYLEIERLTELFMPSFTYSLGEYFIIKPNDKSYEKKVKILFGDTFLSEFENNIDQFLENNFDELIDVIYNGVINFLKYLGVFNEILEGFKPK